MYIHAWFVRQSKSMWSAFYVTFISPDSSQGNNWHSLNLSDSFAALFIPIFYCSSTNFRFMRIVSDFIPNFNHIKYEQIPFPKMLPLDFFSSNIITIRIRVCRYFSRSVACTTYTIIWMGNRWLPFPFKCLESSATHIIDLYAYTISF